MNILNELVDISKLPFAEFILKLKQLEVDRMIGGYLKFSDGLDVFDYSTGNVIFSIDF